VILDRFRLNSGVTIAITIAIAIAIATGAG